jgi:hypothetical protein
MSQLLTPDELERLPLLPTQQLNGHGAATYTQLQEWLLPYANGLETFWWVCFAALAVSLTTRFLWLPLWRGTAEGSAAIAGQQEFFTCPTARIAAWYRRFFSLHEVTGDPIVRWFGGAVLLGFLATFRGWQMSMSTTVQGREYGQVVCWPFFQDCERLIWMETLPHGYSQMTFFMALFGLILLAAYALVRNRVVMAHGTILLLFVAKIYLTLQSFTYNANYDYYHTMFCLVFLFLPHKRFFGSLSLVIFYYFSTATKIHPSWTLGLYFSALESGLPIFPDGIEPVLTNLVIFMEMIMAWFLFSHRKWLQRVVFGFFVLFHLYSGTLVGYHYPTIVMPALILFFGPHFVPFARVPVDRRSLAGWLCMAALFGVQMIAQVIPGDSKMTLEGNFYGLYMFEANHQCVVTFTDEQGNEFFRAENTSARKRCDPWQFLNMAQYRFCDSLDGTKIRYRMIHSINGGPFYETVNEPDLCALRYHPFRHNRWIKDQKTAPIVGRPLKNLYW